MNTFNVLMLTDKGQNNLSHKVIPKPLALEIDFGNGAKQQTT